MTINEIIDSMKFTIEMFLFDPFSGRTKDYSELNKMDKITVNGCSEAIEILNKYKWHHRPTEGWTEETLPEEDGNGETDYVLAMVGDYSWNHFEQAYYNHNKKQWSTYDQNVVAWMYIPPAE